MHVCDQLFNKCYKFEVKKKDKFKENRKRIHFMTYPKQFLFLAGSKRSFRNSSTFSAFRASLTKNS